MEEYQLLCWRQSIMYHIMEYGQTAQTNNNSGESESHGFCIVTPLRLIRKWQFA